MLSWLEIQPLHTAMEPSPLLGRSPSIDLEAVKKEIESLFSAKLNHFEWHWWQSTLDEAKSRQPVDSRRFIFSLSPLDGLCELYIPNVQLENICKHFFDHSMTLAGATQQAFIDYWLATSGSRLLTLPPLNFLQAVALNKSQQIQSPKVIQGQIQIKFEQFEITAQLLLDDKAHTSWLKHWESDPYLSIGSERAKSLELDIELKLGQIELPSATLSLLQIGDWISLESIGLSESLEGSSVELGLSGQSLGRGTVQGQAICISRRDDFFDRLVVN